MRALGLAALAAAYLVGLVWLARGVVADVALVLGG